jgi:predicted ATP-dependent endonuclease of OLD family
MERASVAAVFILLSRSRNLTWMEVSKDSLTMSPGSTYERQRPGDVPPVEHELLVARAAAEEGRTIVLVEGLSDKAAIDALVKRRGRNLCEEGITIVAIGEPRKSGVSLIC